MNQQNLLVFDLETVPDENILPPDRDPEVFPKPIQHRIVSLGFLLARIHHEGDYERYEIHKLSAPGLDQHSEFELLQGFWQLIDRFTPRIVTWNGRGFDAPVLKQRSLIYGLAAHNWHRTDPRYGYDYRYTPKWHCDLMDVLGDYGASPRLGMEQAAVAIGLPGKIESHGSEVAELAAAGDYDKINRYCEGDVVNTYLLYLRWAHFATQMTARGHNATIENLLTFLDAVREERPHLGAFFDDWMASERPKPMYVPEPGENEPGPQPPESHLRSEDVMD